MLLFASWVKAIPECYCNDAMDDTQGDTQDVTQGGTQEEILDNWIEMPYIRYVGSGYSGHWEVDANEGG